MRLLACTLGALALLTGSASAQISSSIPAWGLTTHFYDVGTDPSVDYDAVISDQPIDLDGRSLFALAEGEALCRDPANLQDGLTYTLVSTTGGLSGRMTYDGAPLEDGDEIWVLPIGRSCMNVLGRLEIHYHESGPVQTVTAIVVDGSPIPVTTTRVVAAGGPVETNEPVKLTATVRPSSGPVTGAVSFSDVSAQGELCTDVPVALVDGSWTATCEAGLRASVGKDFIWSGNLRASFTPADAALQVGSSGTNWLTVRAGGTSTSIQVERTASGQALATATVLPAYAGPNVPSGAVRFSEAGTPVSGCEARALAGSTHARATCDLGALSLGDHELVASYLGDDAFDGSQSSPDAFTVTPPVASPQASPPAPVRTATPTTTAKPHRRAAVRRARCRHRQRRHAGARAQRSRPRRCARAHRHRRPARRPARRLTSSVRPAA
ncbi:MAG TPA: Ig-like domain-containing protein [Conexibacter sp.]